MTKQELLIKLASKFYKVGEVQKQREHEGFTYYLVGVYEKTGDSMVRSNLSFYVENEGTVKEAAYWHQREPKPEPTTNLQQEALTYLSKIAGITISNKENVIIPVYIKEAGKLLEKKAFVTKENDTLKHEFIEG